MKIIREYVVPEQLGRSADVESDEAKLFNGGRLNCKKYAQVDSRRPLLESSRSARGFLQPPQDIHSGRLHLKEAE